MRKLLTVAVLVLLAVSGASAAVLCTGASVIWSGGSSTASGFPCEIASSGLIVANPVISNVLGFTFLNITVTGESYNPSTGVVLIDFGLVHTPSPAGSGGGDFIFRYNLYTKAGGADINAVDLKLGASGSGVTTGEAVCADSGCSMVLVNLLASTPGGSDMESLTPPQSWIQIEKDFQFQPGGFLSDFQQSYHVPEPLSFILIGSGLLGLGLLRRRFSAES